MSAALSWHAIATSWTLDIHAVLAIAAAVGYSLVCSKGARIRPDRVVEPARRVSFYLGTLVWLLASISFVGDLAAERFWVRALQIVLLLYVAPMMMAAGRPISAIAATLSPAGRLAGIRLLRSGFLRTITNPITTSAAMLGLPWVLIFSPWNITSVQHQWLDAVTRLIILVVGFGYFYARLQVDPVPHRYPQALSLIITLVETIADGVLGVVLWQGPTLNLAYYERVTGADAAMVRTDQIAAAGILWILADVVGLPFLALLMVALRRDDRRHTADIDAQLDAADRDHAAEADGEPEGGGLWWTQDPTLAQRFGGEH
ncbi:cytochrome c oxidase assembly protein [Jongsikchunia kroppenstedtii]|uniref:cytochrome c oxidase assembly protein n=1 Tax=Jongsikchunia kroppenstedtii TaxID=1121721 RepID=UPI0004780A11|nr:cytochrome c oxidase assembly protein [Jongsikchunia kroppenstedtii]